MPLGMTGTRLTIIAVGVTGTLALFGMSPAPSAPQTKPVTLAQVAATPPQPAQPEPDPPKIIWSGALDHSYSVLRGSFTLVNPNKVPLKDIVLACDTRGASGTVIRQQRFTVYQSIPANGKRFVKDFTFGFWPPQGAQFACSAALK